MWHVPRSNLCPPLPRCLNYLHWIEDLLFTLQVDTSRARGIDIGCGASCIFPLIGCKLHAGWKFIATDIAAASIQAAKAIVNDNRLENRIILLQSEGSGEVFPSVEDLDVNLDLGGNRNDGSKMERICGFTMCNPPFFGSEETARKSRKRKSGFAGMSHEVWSETEDEVSLVKRMIDESIGREELHERIALFTSMVGIKADLAPILEHLICSNKQEKIKFWRACTLRQGNTFRWCVAWSFLPVTTSPEIQVSAEMLQRKLKPTQVEVLVDLTCEQIKERAVESVRTAYERRFRWNSSGDLVIIYKDEDKVALVLSCFVVVGNGKLTLILADETHSDRQAFTEFSQRIRADVVRTNRYWRRKMARKNARNEDLGTTENSKA